jgi:hypothetical protein
MMDGMMFSPSSIHDLPLLPPAIGVIAIEAPTVPKCGFPARREPQRTRLHRKRVRIRQFFKEAEKPELFRGLVPVE